MADNVVQTGNSTISTDDIGGGVQVQRVKVQYGPDGSATDVSPNTGLPITGSQPASPTIGTYTSSTGTANTSLNIPIAGYNTVSVGVMTTTTVTAGILSFEVSLDNTNWFPIAMNRIDIFSAATTYTLAASTSVAFSGSVDAFSYFRVRISTAFAGTGAVTIAVMPQTFPIEPTVTVGQATASNLNVTVGNQVTIATGTNTIGTVNMTGRTSGGSTPYTLISAASTNATLIATGAHTVYGIQATNNTTTNAFLKLYNLTTAPTVGTSVAIKTILLAPNNTTAIDLPVQGVAFSTGLSFAITGAGTTADTTAVAAAQVIVNIDYV